MSSSETTAAPIEWATTIMFALTTLVTVTVVPIYAWFNDFSATAWISALLLWVYCGIAIGSGYHRLWSHRTYEAHWLLKLFFAIGGAFALQHSILQWSARHRVHHRHVDEEEKDPHSIKRGFWYAHMGWMIRDYEPARIGFDKVPDLKRDPIVMWQHRNYWLLTWTANLGVPALIGLIAGDLWGCLLLAGFARLVLNHQVTFMINSLAHMWGNQPYTEENTARDNWLIALVTCGEGYHNFHHMFEGDYRNGVRWWQIDLNKWFINVCSWFGLAKNFRRTPKIQILRAKVKLQFERAQARLSRIESGESSFRDTLDAEYEQFLATVKAWQELQVQRVQKKRADLQERWSKTAISTRMRELEYSLKMQRKRISHMVAAIPVT
ncbi:MAG: fatty acid desaturase [Pseudomonadota bacterium]